jgi:hypothetical protein
MVDSELREERAESVVREQARIEARSFHRAHWRWNAVIIVAFLLFAAWAYYGYTSMRSAEPPEQTTGQSQPAPSPPAEAPSANTTR